MYNDNVDDIIAVNKEKTFQGVIGAYGWEKSKIWEEKQNFKDIRGEWSNNDEGRTVEEHRKIVGKIKQCHKLAHMKDMDCAYDDKDLSISFKGKITYKKTGSLARNLIGQKYVTQYLRKKYETELSRVYLKERRRS